MPVFAFGPWNLVLVCVSPAIEVVAKSANEANVASSMDFIVLVFCLCLLSINFVFVFAGVNRFICDFKSVAAPKPYNPAASWPSEALR